MNSTARFPFVRSLLGACVLLLGLQPVAQAAQP